jgi:xylulokinase
MSVYLGLDSSTQGLKAICIDPERGDVIASATVNYGEDLPAYGCPNGFLDHPDPLVKHADPLVWLAALDLVLQRLRDSGAPMDAVAGISGSGQQHGSVYLNSGFADALRTLDPRRDLASQLASTLSRATAPIWMDSSTSRECRELDEAIGGRLQRDTGSPAIERFTGPQIRRFWREDPEAYESTELIHLVSSFLASVLCGVSVPIDFGDGAGMNLLNLRTLQWDQEIARATAPGLLERLPPVTASTTVADGLHPYFCKYGLRAGTPVVVWSGDNPNSLIGTGAGTPGTAVISLGTSDTFFAAMDAVRVDPDGYGHVFGNPAGGFMSLICFKNGSLARERVRDDCGVDWKTFDVTAFADTPPGNNGNLMLPYFVPEITPLVLETGVRRQGTAAFEAGKAPASVRIRAVVEAQALTMKLHSQWMGTDFDTVRITGGASRSQGLAQVLADVFQARIERIAVPDSAGLGAAMRATQAVGKVPWSDLNHRFAACTDAVEPRSETASVYADRLQAYADFEANAS